VRPSEVSNRIASANEILLQIGSSTVIGDLSTDDLVEYVDEDGLVYSYQPMITPKDSNDD
jgi:hypothetical protein